MSVAGASDILTELLSVVGFDNAPLDRLEIIDDGVALPTPWPITANAVAVLAAVGLAASHLGSLRRGTTEPVRVRSFHAGLSMACSSYLTRDGHSAKFRDPFTGFYEAAHGRWVFLHGNFPHLRKGVLALLGVETLEAVADAVRLRDAFELEALGIANGLCIAAVRTRSEWQAELQSAAVGALPLVEIDRMDDGASRVGDVGDGPLGGVRMLDLSRVIAGPMAGRTIAEFGGDVLLVSGPGLPSIDSLVIDTGFAKRSAMIDLSSAQERARFEDLIATSDIFLDAYRPGALPGRGYDRARLAELRPGLVHVDLDAFSRLGPWAGRRGYDSLVQATVGMCWDGQSPPENLPCQPLDYLTGYLGALTAMVGLIRRLERGGGWGGRISLARTAQWMWDTYDRLGPDQDAPDARISIDEARTRGYLDDYATDFGAIEALKSALQADGWRWPAPPVPLGAHPPHWR